VIKEGKRHNNTVSEDQCINGDGMPLDSCIFQRRSSRARKNVDNFILSDVNTQKSTHNAQIDVFDFDRRTDEREKSPSVDERENIVKSPVHNENTCLYYAIINSLGTEK